MTAALLVAAVSMIFSGVQTRHATIQTQQAGIDAALAGHAAELTFNLDVMIRLQQVLFAIADDPASHASIWGTADVENRRPGVAVQSLLDVLSMALAAVERLPAPAQDGADWASYTRHVLARSRATLDEVLAHCDWWPEVVPFANELVGPDSKCPSA